MADFITKEAIMAQAIEYARNTPNVDVELAKKVITFISMLKHTGGDLAGVNFQLLPFQIKFLIDVICTMKNGKRQYTTAMLMIPRKNGKTELIGAVLNYFLFMDKESGKEIYCCANETDQARIIFKATESMINQNSYLENNCETYKSTRMIEKNSQFEDYIKVLTSNADTKDGLKPYVAVYDELHASKSAELYTVIEEGMAHRSSPLFIIISTAGYNHQGVMKQKYDYAKKVKSGIIDDPSFYSMIFEPGEDDDWEDENTWIKCNPALGYGVKIDYLRNKFIKAQHSGEDEVAFKTKHLNMWTSASSVWIKNKIWNASTTPTVSPKNGAVCYGGLDLSSTTDISALVLVFPSEKGVDVLCKFWIPEDKMMERSKKDKVPYLTWVRDGFITATPGMVIDYGFIERDIIELCEKYDMKLLAYDRWNSSSLVQTLEDSGISSLVPFGQGFASMSSPTKEIETLALQQKLNHGNHPVLNWMASNVAIQRDASDNIKIDKSKSSEKVDGMVALAMALGVQLADRKTEDKSIYETRGMRSL